MTVSRRRILQTLAIGAGAATFAPVLRKWQVRDVKAASSPPKRLMIFFHPNGFRDLAVDQLPVIDPVNFKLGAMSSPLERHRQDLGVLRWWRSGCGAKRQRSGGRSGESSCPTLDRARDPKLSAGCLFRNGSIGRAAPHGGKSQGFRVV